MASLLSFAKKKLQQIEDVGSRAFDQINPLDNGRTWSQRTPTNNNSALQQAAPIIQRGVQNSPVAKFGRALGGAASQIPEVGDNSPLRFLNTAVIKPIKTTDINVAKLAQGKNPYSGNLKQQTGQVLQDLVNIASVVPVGKGVQLATKGLPAVKQGAIQGAKVGAGFGAAQGTATALKDNQNLTDALKTIGLSTGVGTIGGSALGAAAPIVGVGVRQGAKTLDNRTPLLAPQTGSISAGGNPKVPKLKLPVSELSKQTSLESMVKAPTPPKGQARGFTGNMAKTNFSQGNPTAQAVVEAIPGYKPITNKSTLNKAAKEIGNDPNSAYARIVTKPQLTSADDVATGNLLLRQAVESGDTESAIQLGTKLGVDGTKLGQAVQAYSTWKKTTPEGIVTYASKQAGKAGKDLDPIVTKELIDKAKVIANMPESFEKAKATRELLGEADGLGKGYKDLANEIFNVPRAAMATGDFSAPFRQGAILGSRFPNQFRKAFTESAKYMFKPEYYEREMYALTQRPTYPLMKSRKLAVDAAEELTGTEEQFLGSILEGNIAKKLGFGHVVAASDRAYSGFLTKFRADVFDKVLTDTQKAGVKLDNKQLDSLTKFINSASGRGQGNVTDQVSRLQVLFSARLWKSRLDALNPAYYARLDPTARKYALQSAASFAGIATTMLGLAKASGLGDVNADPRSADFGKIKVGNTRYDILGGLQQNIRLAAQLATGEKINSTTGQVQTLGADRGFGKPSRLDILYQFVENKENPIIAFGTKALRGTDPTGKPINLAAEAGKLFVPLNIQSAYETSKDRQSIPEGLAMNLPGPFGIGVQTYGKKPDKPAKATPEEKEKELKTNPQAEYQQALDRFNKNVQENKLTDAQKFKAEKDLEKLKIGSSYDKELRDIYKLPKSSLNAYVNGKENKDEITKQLLEYDQKLFDAGLISSLKFKNGIAPVAKKGRSRKAASGRRGGGSGGGGAKSTKVRFVTAGFNTGKTKGIKLPKGVKVRTASLKKTPLKKLAISKIPKQKIA